MTLSAGAAATARRVYAALARRHPAARAGYESQMLATFEKMLATAAPRGRIAIAALLVRETAGLFFNRRTSCAPSRSDTPLISKRPVMASIQGIQQDLRYAVRTFRRRPGFTAALLVTLALGIGASTAIFSVTNAVLFQRLPFVDSGRLVMVWEDAASIGFPRNTPSPASYADWTSTIPAFEGIAAIDQRAFNLAGDGDPEKIGGGAVSANIFAVLGVQPALGRVWRVDEDRPGARLAVLSYGLWMRRFGGDPAILARPVLFDGSPYTILGVMPPRFEVVSPDMQMWVPIGFTAAELANRGNHYLWVVARLRATATLAQANAQLGGLARRLQREHPETNRTTGMYAVSLLDDYIGDTRTALLVLVAAVVCVLLIACANVANLLLSRAAGRSREMAIRAALGAGRRRLIRQLMTESLLLAIVGGVLGVVVATWSFSTLTHLVPEALVGLSQVRLDARVLVASFGMSVLTGVLFGLAPARRASRVDLAAAGGQRGARGLLDGHTRVRSSLVVAEIALATILLVGAALLIESFQSVRAVDLGFRPDRVLTLRLLLPRQGYADFDKRIQFVDRVLERVRALPGVASAGFTSAVPLVWKGGTNGFAPEGRAVDRSLSYDANNRVVGPGYMETMGMTLRRGRFFDTHDDASSRFVAIINETMARQYWPGEDSMGRRFTIGAGPSSPPRTIVGIVADTRVMGIDQATRAEMYFPIQQSQDNWMWPRDLVIRTTNDPMTVAASVRQAVWSIDPRQPVSNVATMDQIVDAELQSRQMPTVLMTAFAGFALLLAAVGIYGVLSYSVTARTAEIGLRLALGGDPRRIRATVVGQGLALVGLGLAIGLAAAFWGTQLLERLLFGVRQHDPRIFAAQAVVLGAVCLMAAYLPARRASRIDPVSALRSN